MSATSGSARRVRVTSSLAARVDPDEVARALGAERASPPAAGAPDRTAEESPSSTADWMTPDAAATWLHAPCGGYGYAMSVDAVIVRQHGQTATIEVTTRSGQKVLRCVSISNLRRRAAV